MIDELNAAAGRDPVEYRRTLLKDRPRLRRVLDLAAEKACWGTRRHPVVSVVSLSMNPSRPWW